ncbi:uncharacterized protein LOC123349879 isoform X2 [Mauremys mutica]|nr:uncharacterized protein LOC123349879 isoform X2 [Mauremys mutica]XP_044844081.1 uncharacterized protein LOC123349879 isoform X2 [Mauremys mutica]
MLVSLHIEEAAFYTHGAACPLHRMINNFSEVKGAFVRQRLTANLATLRKDQFKKFKDVLCETPVKDLVRAGDEFLDAPNTFQRDASLETLVEDLIGKFGRTNALRAAATVMEKIGRRDLAKELERELHDVAETQHELERRKVGPGVTLIGFGVGALAGAGYWAMAAASVTGASMFGPVTLGIASGAAVWTGIKYLRK